MPAEAESRIRGLLDGRLSAADRQAAMEHLRLCIACREVYDGVATAEHAAAGGSGVLGLPALERVAARLESEPVFAPRRRAWARWAGATAAAAGMLVLALRVGWTPPDDGFTPRGGPIEDGVGIRLFRVGADGAAELKDGGVVSLGEELGVSVSTGPYAKLHLAVRGRNASLAETKETIARGMIDEPLDWTTRVGPDFLDAGTVTLEASFSEPSSAAVPAIAERVMRVHVKKATPP